MEPKTANNWHRIKEFPIEPSEDFEKLKVSLKCLHNAIHIC